jgi:hypothetical protein
MKNTAVRIRTQAIINAHRSIIVNSPTQDPASGTSISGQQ